MKLNLFNRILIIFKKTSCIYIKLYYTVERFVLVLFNYKGERMSSWREEKLKPLIDSMAKDRNIDAETMIQRLEACKPKELKPMSEQEREEKQKEMEDFFRASDETGIRMLPLNEYDKDGNICGVDWKGSSEVLRNESFKKEIFENI